MRTYTDIIDEFISQIKLKTGNKELYIFGAGNYGNVFGKFFNQKAIEWKGYIDNNAEIQYTTLNDKLIYPIDVLDKNNQVCVFVSLSILFSRERYMGVLQQLSDRGIDKDDIICFEGDYATIDKIVYEVKKPEKYLRKLKELQGIYSDRRCFIIGNGPSLTLEDLERLSGEVTMGCNRLCQLYDKTSWRPTCFFFEDANFARNYVDDRDKLIELVNNCEMAFTVINNDIYEKYKDIYNNIYYMYTERNFEDLLFSDNIEEVVYASGTTLFSMLQVAAYMGIKEIYLLGVDFTFHKEAKKNGKIVINKNVKNHMALMSQDETGIYNIDLILRGYRAALKYADEHGIKIYNATRGGKLEIFERVNFDSLFLNSESN